MDIKCIKDWKKFIAKDTTEFEKKIYNQLTPKVDEFKQIIQNNLGWELWYENQMQDIKIEAKISDKGNTIVRAQGLVNWSPKDIVHFTLKKDSMRDIEENLESYDIIGSHKQNLFMITKKTTQTLILPPS